MIIKAENDEEFGHEEGFLSVIQYNNGKATGSFNGMVKDVKLYDHSIINNFRDWLFVNVYLAPVSIISAIISGIMLFISLLREDNMHVSENVEE